MWEARSRGYFFDKRTRKGKYLAESSLKFGRKNEI